MPDPTAPHVKANDGKTYLLPFNPKWQSGCPSEPGWYPASIVQDSQCIRWFDGEAFSKWACLHETEEEASERAAIRSIENDFILWSAPWWTALEQACIQRRAIDLGYSLPEGYEPIADFSLAQPHQKSEEAPSLQAQQIQAIQALSPVLPQSTRLFINGRVILITLSGTDLTPGVPDGPSNADIQAAIGQLKAMQTSLSALRAELLTKDAA